MTAGTPHAPAVGPLRIVAARPWPGTALAVSPDGAWVAVALPGRVIVATLPTLDDVREIAVADVRSLAALGPTRLAMAPRRGLLVIADPTGACRVGVRARGSGRVSLAAGPDGRLAVVGEHAALPRATVVARSDGGRHRDWTAAIPRAGAAAWVDDDLVVAAGTDLVLVRRGDAVARVARPLGEPIAAAAAVPGGVALAGAGDQAVIHPIAPGVPRHVIAVPPGSGRTLEVSGGVLVACTRSLGERVSVHDLASGKPVASLLGVAVGVPAPPLVVATGREGTVVAGP